MNNEIKSSNSKLLLETRKLSSRSYNNVRHLKFVRGLGEGKNFINAEQNVKLTEIEKRETEKMNFFNNLGRAIKKIGE